MDRPIVQLAKSTNPLNSHRKIETYKSNPERKKQEYHFICLIIPMNIKHSFPIMKKGSPHKAESANRGKLGLYFEIK